MSKKLIKYVQASVASGGTAAKKPGIRNAIDRTVHREFRKTTNISFSSNKLENYIIEQVRLYKQKHNVVPSITTNSQAAIKEIPRIGRVLIFRVLSDTAIGQEVTTKQNIVVRFKYLVLTGRTYSYYKKGSAFYVEGEYIGKAYHTRSREAGGGFLIKRIGNTTSIANDNLSGPEKDGEILQIERTDDVPANSAILYVSSEDYVYIQDQVYYNDKDGVSISLAALLTPQHTVIDIMPYKDRYVLIKTTLGDFHVSFGLLIIDLVELNAQLLQYTWSSMPTRPSCFGYTGVVANNDYGEYLEISTTGASQSTASLSVTAYKKKYREKEVWVDTGDDTGYWEWRRIKNNEGEYIYWYESAESASLSLPYTSMNISIYDIVDGVLTSLGSLVSISGLLTSRSDRKSGAPMRGCLTYFTIQRCEETTLVQEVWIWYTQIIETYSWSGLEETWQPRKNEYDWRNHPCYLAHGSMEFIPIGSFDNLELRASGGGIYRLWYDDFETQVAVANRNPTFENAGETIETLELDSLPFPSEEVAQMNMAYFRMFNTSVAVHNRIYIDTSPKALIGKIMQSNSVEYTNFAISNVIPDHLNRRRQPFVFIIRGGELILGLNFRMYTNLVGDISDDGVWPAEAEVWSIKATGYYVISTQQGTTMATLLPFGDATIRPGVSTIGLMYWSTGSYMALWHAEVCLTSVVVNNEAFYMIASIFYYWYGVRDATSAELENPAVIKWGRKYIPTGPEEHAYRVIEASVEIPKVGPAKTKLSVFHEQESLVTVDCWHIPD